MVEEKHYFTVAEANAMVPWLEQVFFRIMQLHRHIQSIFQRLSMTGNVPKSENFSLNPPGASPQLVDDLATLKMLLDELKNQLVSILDRGVIVKDLETGLVDWYSQREGQDILLCWRYGEKSVDYWHPLDTGIKGRRPIEDM